MHKLLKMESYQDFNIEHSCPLIDDLINCIESNDIEKRYMTQTLEEIRQINSALRLRLAQCREQIAEHQESMVDTILA